MREKLAKIFNMHSFKNRLTVMLLLSALIPVCILGLISYYTNYSLLENKVEKGMQSSLTQRRLELEGVFANLDYSSIQLMYVGSLGQKMYSFLESESSYIRAQMSMEIKDGIRLISYTNTNLGIICYFYSGSNKTMFENNEVQEKVDFKKLKTLIDYRNFYFYGPNRTIALGNDGVVFSLIRKVNIPYRNDVNIYIETNTDIIKRIFDHNQYGMKGIFLLLDNEGKVVYSENGKKFPHNTMISGNSQYNSSKYYIFKDVSQQGWQLAIAVLKTDFNNEINRWILQYIGAIILILSCSLILALLVWKMVQRPLRNINREVEIMSNSKFDSPVRLTGLTEFDNLLNKFYKMRQNIKELFVELEQNERLKSQLEIDKLLFQINPHFLHNTLNSVQWIARMNGQEEIDHMLSALTRLLHYNLGKEGRFMSIAEEIDSLNDYIGLQQLRTNNKLTVNYEIDKSVMGLKIPRFILQPLVENAIYHGLADEGGIIEVNIKLVDNSRLLIKVIDNGAGMSEEKVKSLIEEGQEDYKKIGMGIGLNYVICTIKGYYNNGKFSIESEIDAGTTIIIDIPIINND